jgi:hypothetical protein
MADAPLITPENLTKDMLKLFFDSASMENSFDSHGDLEVRDGYGVWVMPGENYIHLQTLFRFKDGIDEYARLQFVNKSNREWRFIRSGVNERGTLVLDYYMPVAGGVSAVSIVLITKRFLSIVDLIIKDGIEIIS